MDQSNSILLAMKKVSVVFMIVGEVGVIMIRADVNFLQDMVGKLASKEDAEIPPSKFQK